MNHRMRRVLLGAALGAILLLGAPGVASAQTAEGEAVRGTVEKIDGETREPVAGVTIIVSLDGAEVGRGSSDAAGEWLIPVPGPNTYQVELDTATLPPGVGLTDPDRRVLPDVVVRAGRPKTVRFALGPGVTSTVSTWDRVGGLFIVGLKFGAIIALASIGLSLIFGVTGLVNFAHGDTVTLGAVLAFFFNASPLGPEWNILIAAIPAVLLVALFGGFQEWRIWRPLRRRRTGLVSLIVISIGLSFIIRYGILVMFSGLPRPYADYAVQANIDFLGIQTVSKNLIIVVFTAVVLAAVGLFLQRTKLGTAMRAVADNTDLAESSGIDVQRVILVTWILGTGLAGVGGVMFGVSEQVQWDMGFKLLLLIFAAVILGGLGTAFGAMLGGFVIGVAVEMSTLWVPVEFKQVIALGILILMLLFRPQGLLGSRERIG